MQRVCRRGFKPELIVKGARVLICMCDHGSHSYDLGSSGATQQRILQEGGADSPSLVLAIHG